MLFNSWKFLLFFPTVVSIYFFLPYKIRAVWLLSASFFFYMCWNPKYIVLIGTSILVTYGAGILVEQENKQHRKKYWLLGSLALNLGILVLFKYFDFFFRSISALSGLFGLYPKKPAFNLLLPVGISFYTFQALSYTIDVYRGEIKAEKNLVRYALFVSFFPQLVAGPIERSGHLLSQLGKKHCFNWNRLRDGLLLMLWGYFEKMVIADRIAILVDTVYQSYTSYNGVQIMAATALFAFQVYCDFSGYSDIAIGAAKILGIDLMQNFRQPYLSRSIPEFWRRWHISLSTWFRDYLYIPLGGNRKGSLYRYRNIVIVFLVSGLWHGASWNYILWGGLHGFYQVAGSLLAPAGKHLIKKYQIKTDCFSWRLFQTVRTFLLADFAWLFFRAPGAKAALKMLAYSLCHLNPFPFLNQGFLSMGLSSKNILVLMAALAVLFGVDYARSKGGFKERFFSQNPWFCYGTAYMLMLTVLFFGIYGAGYHPAQFLYFQF